MPKSARALVLFIACGSIAYSFTSGNVLVLISSSSQCSTRFSNVQLKEFFPSGTAGTTVSISQCQVSGLPSTGRLTLGTSGSVVSFGCKSTQAGTPMSIAEVDWGGLATFTPLSIVAYVLGTVGIIGALSNSLGGVYTSGDSYPNAAYISGGGSSIVSSSFVASKFQVLSSTLYATSSTEGNCQLFRIGNVGSPPPTSAPLNAYGLGQVGSYDGTACGRNDVASSFVFNPAGTLVYGCVWGGDGHKGVYSLVFSQSTQAVAVGVAQNRVYSGGSCIDIAGQTESGVFTLYFIGTQTEPSRCSASPSTDSSDWPTGGSRH
jgi:hypothetical protein